MKSAMWMETTFLPALARDLERLSANEAMRYATRGGKRLRPQLLWEVAAALSGGTLDDATTEALTHAAVALELVHAYSLVHDDLPAMDDDTLRRGQPTVHCAFGEAEGVLCGDALLNGAFEVLFEATSKATPPLEERLVTAGLWLARAAGSRGMIGGQRDDLALQHADAEKTRRMVEKKTGALFEAACAMGAVLVGATEEDIEKAAAFGRTFGLLFQLADDCADREQDERQGKWTWAVALGDALAPTLEHLCDEAVALARELRMDHLTGPIHQIAHERRMT
ncbi:MAG: polyprenyl synthetase family protein [Peptoniphilaceae bacterium]|nr:polyprenyl synthetase family protein [Peptoniphilaceae bacterium]MDY6086021.1 polyprenyl synthetase family protein [Peptoniphilaceae bacterium]